MIAIDCDKKIECIKFKKQVTPCCYGAILLEDVDDWGKMRGILRAAKLKLIETPDNEELVYFLEKVHNGIGVWPLI